MTGPRRRDVNRTLWALPLLALAGCGDGSSSTASSTSRATPQPSITSPREGSAPAALNGGAFVVDRQARQVMASGNDVLLVWEDGTPDPVREVPGDDGGVYGLSLQRPVLVLTDDGTAVVSPVDGSEVARHEVTTPVSGEQSTPVRAAVDETAGVAVVAGGRDRELRVWDLEAGTSRVVAEDLDRVVGVAMVDEQAALLLTHGAKEPGRLRRVSLTDGSESSPVETADPRTLAYHAGRDLAAVAGVDAPDQRSIRFYEGAKGTEVGHVGDLAASPLWMAFSPDGSRLAVSDTETLAVVDVEAMTLTPLTGGADRPLGVAWLDDETLIVGGGAAFEVWDVAAGTVTDRLEAPEGDASTPLTPRWPG